MSDRTKSAEIQGLFKGRIVRHGIAVPVLAIIGVGLRPRSFVRLERVAQFKSKLARGKAKPCLTTRGKAERMKPNF